MKKEQEIVSVVSFGRLRNGNDLWVEGAVRDLAGGKVIRERCWFQAKVFNEGSEYGIDQGRVSKLLVRRKMPDGHNIDIINYDRDWDIRPEDDDANLLLNIVLHALENMDKYEV
jgi:hypothetical protein